MVDRFSLLWGCYENPFRSEREENPLGRTAQVNESDTRTHITTPSVRHKSFPGIFKIIHHSNP